jgi:hypothetical protein
LDQPPVPTTPTFTWVTINGFNIIAMLDSGAGISIISWQPELAHVFQKASFRPLPEPRTISGVGTSVAREYVKPVICFRGVAGQYVSVQPTFLVATLSVPLILIGQDVLKGAQILITPEPAFALSLTCPEVVFPCCNTATAIPRTHIRSLEETINGYTVLRDLNPHTTPRTYTEPRATIEMMAAIAHASALTCYMAAAAQQPALAQDNNPPETATPPPRTAAIDEKLLHEAISHRGLPMQATSPHQLTIEQVNFLCRLFDLDRHSTTSAYSEFEKVLHEHLKVELGRDPLVVFMLILLLRRFAKAFSFPGNELGRFTGFKFKLEIAKPLPPSPKPRQYNVRDTAEIIKWLERLIALGVYVIASNATAVFLSCIHVVYKQGKKPRPTGDYRLLNLHTKDSPDNIHFMERTLSWIVNQHFRYISNMDLNQGFYQCPVDDESQKLLALRMPLGDAIPNMCSMGPKQVPGHFTKVMNHVMGPGNWRGLAAFVDDLHAKGTDAFLQLLWIGYILHRMIKFNMTFDLAKCHWLMEKLTALGFLTGNMTISPDPGKVEALLKLRKPADLNELRSYNGMLTFYSRFFPEYASRFCLLQAPVNASLEQFFKSNPRKKPLKKDNDVVLPWAHTTSTSTTVKEGSNAAVKPLDQIADLVDDVQAARPVAKNKSKKQARYLAKFQLSGPRR